MIDFKDMLKPEGGMKGMGHATITNDDWYILFEKARCPKRHMEMTKFSGEQWLKTLALLKQWVDKGGFMCALIGERGPGKTQLGVEAIRYACKKGIECSYKKTCEVFMEIKAGYRMDRSEDESLRPFLRSQLLVLDEVQERSESDWENRLLTYLIDKRYDNCKSTILIGNLNQGSVVDCLGSSIYSRLIETGGVVECNWETFRK